MKVRVWGYRDGTLLPHGFEVEVGNRSGKPKPEGMSEPFGTLEGEMAALDGVMALLQSTGVEVAIGTDRADEFNEDVETWEAA